MDLLTGSILGGFGMLGLMWSYGRKSMRVGAVVEKVTVAFGGHPYTKESLKRLETIGLVKCGTCGAFARPQDTCCYNPQRKENI